MTYSDVQILFQGKVLKQINKRKAKRLYEAGKRIFLHPCKMSFFSPWSTPCETPPKAEEEMTFEAYSNSFSDYNCTNETGTYIQYLCYENDILSH